MRIRKHTTIQKKFGSQSTLNLNYYIMKTYLLRPLLLLAIIFTMNSCSSDSSEASVVEAKSQEVLNFTYSANELETMKLINDYRVSLGLNALERINHISFKSEEHDDYMIANNVVNHNDFVARSENIIRVLGANTVGENIAYNYNSPQAAFNAWLKSPAHKENIVGNFTHFGIAIRSNTTTGKLYYTNIFAKI
jgi:uncharacterized protein YkwD